MTALITLLRLAGRVLIAVSEELAREMSARGLSCPDVIPAWVDEATDV
jgi:hypothetical protein